MKRFNPLLVAIVLFCPPVLDAEGVRLTFLGDEHALQDTLSFLSSLGFDATSTGTLHAAAVAYFSEGFDIDLAKFPKQKGGYYTFSSMKKVVECLPSNAFANEHASSLNCYDSVIAIAHAELKMNLDPDRISGVLLVPLLNTNKEPPGFDAGVAATPRDAFNTLYPPSYTSATDKFFPPSLQDARICLTIALYRERVLPSGVAEENLGGTVMEVLKSDCRRDGFEFPTRFELVLIHGVSGRHSFDHDVAEHIAGWFG